MSSNLEPTNQGVRPNPPPKPECCREKGQMEAASSRGDRTISWKRTQGNSPAASGSGTPLKQSSPETVRHAGGDGVILPEPNKEETVEGEVSRNLPGSQSVAREEQTVRNLGGPADPRRANYGSQAGRSDQRQTLARFTAANQPSLLIQDKPGTLANAAFERCHSSVERLSRLVFFHRRHWPQERRQIIDAPLERFPSIDLLRKLRNALAVLLLSLAGFPSRQQLPCRARPVPAASSDD